MFTDKGPEDSVEKIKEDASLLEKLGLQKAEEKKKNQSSKIPPEKITPFDITKIGQQQEEIPTPAIPEKHPAPP